MVHFNFRKHKRSPSPVLQQVPLAAKEPECYQVDRSCNKHIYKFGSIFEGEVARYKVKERRVILGFEHLRVLDLSREAVKAEIKRERRLRYFSKRNRSRLVTSGEVFPGNKNHQDLNENLTVITVAEPLLSVSLPNSIASSSTTLTKAAELNRLVYQSPDNVQAWLELITLQLPAGSNGEFSSFSTRRFTLLEKQIVIVERAISMNSGNLKLRILLAGLRELATQLIFAGGASIRTGPDPLVQKNLIAQEWTNLVFTCPQFVGVWRGYLAHLRGRFAVQGSASSIFNRIDAIYRRAITTLSGIVSGRILSHKPQEDTPDLTVGKWLSSLVRAGLSCLAILFIVYT